MFSHLVESSTINYFLNSNLVEEAGIYIVLELKNMKEADKRLL